MQKLKLESLQVESFETIGAELARRGTVAGNAASDVYSDCCAGTEISWCSACFGSFDLPCEPTKDPAVSTCTDADYTYFGCSFGCTDETMCCPA